MKLALTLAAFLRAVIPASAQEVDPSRILAVVIHIEDGKWSDPGGAGHMIYSTWTDYSKHSYQLASHEKYAMPIYRIHVAKLTRLIRKAGVSLTPENIAIAWRRGFDGAVELKWQDEYGRRAANLYLAKDFP